MDVNAAYAIVRDQLDFDPGRFFNRGEGLSLGVGQVYRGVRFPMYNIDDALFDTVEGHALVLTHECDVDQENRRPFADYLLISPIIEFEALIQEYSRRLGDDRLQGFLVELAKRNVSRVAYLPWGLATLPYGGVINLNQICSTHVSAFESGSAEVSGATTSYGLQIIDHQLTNHLFRPKTQSLGLCH